MKHIVYIGNNLSEKSKYVPTLVTLSNLLKKEGYRVTIASDKTNKLLRIFDMIFTVIWNSRKADVVLIDTFGAFNFYYALIISQLCRLLRLKYIPILHGGNLPDRLQSKPGFSKKIFANSYQNVAPSNYLKTAFENKGYPTQRIPNIVEIDDYKFKERKVFQPILLFVRAFHQIYNPTMAVSVLHHVKKKYPNATLCMIGPAKDDSFDDTKALARKLGVEGSITYTGVLPKKEWHKLAEEFDIFINTTTVDNTPISVMEAMAMGLPVVSTNVGGIPYLLEDASDAFLVPSGDYKAMSQVIIDIVEQRNNVFEVVQNARKKVEQFDWAVIRTDWISLLNNLPERSSTKWFDWVYQKSPVFMQNLMISFYGIYWKNRRLGGDFEKYKKEFEQRESYSKKAWDTYQTDELRKLLIHAFTTVPFYKELYTLHGFTLQDFEKFRIEDLKRLPYLEKDDLRKFGKTSLLSTKREKGTFYLSSGSTGTPISIYISKGSHQKWNAAYEVRVRNWAGLHYRMSRAMIGGRRIVPNAVTKPPYYRYNWAESQAYFSAYHISERNVEEYVNGLLKLNTKYLVGYAMSIYLLASAIEKQHLKAPKFEAVLTSSEKLTKVMRTVIEKVFQCRVYDAYSGVEACGLISEDIHGELLHSADSGIMEVVDRHGNQVAFGASGEVVATGFLNYDQPLIRYRIGDRVKLSENQQTKSGMELLKVDEIEGRVEDVVIGLQGQKMVRFHGIFVGIPSIIMAQVIQNSLERMTLKLVVDNSYTNTQEAVMIQRIQSQLGAVKVDFEYVEEIEKTKNGKFKAVISNLVNV
jgi:phenylacetate-CoA ligase